LRKVTKSARTSTLKNRHIVAYVTKLDDFYLLGKKNSYKSCPNILEKNLAILNNATFVPKMIWLLFGQCWEKLGNFLFHRLVALEAIIITP